MALSTSTPAKAVLVLALVLSGFAPVAAQERSDAERADRERATPIPSAGFWPTDKLINNMLDRAVEGMIEEYEFDPEQAARTAEILKTRFPRWLQENRAEIQTLMNEYLEALTEAEPPTPERVAQWAQRVQPLVGGFQELVNDMTGEMAEFMTEDQQVNLEGHMAAFTTGIGFMQNKLGVWSEGGYDPETEWPRNAEARQRRRAEERALKEQMRNERNETLAEMGAGPDGKPLSADAAAAANNANAGENQGALKGGATPQDRTQNKPRPARPAAAEKDEWTRYVDEFVRRYDLNEDQKGKAYTYLKAKQDDRDAYLNRKKSDIAAAEKAVKDAKTDESRATAKKQLDELNKPIDRYFTQLKDRLNTLPTRDQRKKAALEEAEKKETPASSKSDGKAPAVSEAKKP
ncbi:MAG: hypothetical protein AB7Q17_16535 [Phycisphaerae bacterium]